MRDYELSVVIRPDIDDNQTKAAAARVQGLITSRGGEISNVQEWGKRRLAYHIGHHAEGSYFIYRLGMEPTEAADIEHELNLDEQVLRFIMLYLDPVALEALKNPPAPMAPRPERRPAEGPAPAEAPAEEAAAEAAPMAEAAEEAGATAASPSGEEVLAAPAARTSRSRPAPAVASEAETGAAVPDEGESVAAVEAGAAEEAVAQAAEEPATEPHTGEATES